MKPTHFIGAPHVHDAATMANRDFKSEHSGPKSKLAEEMRKKSGKLAKRIPHMPMGGLKGIL